MKKIVKKFALFVLFTLSALTAGCVSIEPDNSASIETAKSEEVEEENSNEGGIYAGEMAKVYERISAGLTGLGNQTILLGSDPSLKENERWVLETIKHLLMIQSGIDTFNELNPPNEFKGSYDFAVKAMNQFQFVVDKYPVALDNDDYILMNEVTTHIYSAGDYLEASTEQFGIEASEYLN